jgi:AcrR family transcriptional regulator
MPRWEPNGRERLVTAAMELFEARGYDQTSVADIALRAGLTERTFFNCFPDKREVLFHGAEKLEAFLVEAAASAPKPASGMETVSSALLAVARASDAWPGFADFARRRHALLQVHAELRERELTKLASLGSAMAGALRRRGLSAPKASLAAEVGIAVFKVAFERCQSDPKRRKLAVHLHAAMADLAALEMASNGADAEKPWRGGKGPASAGRGLKDANGSPSAISSNRRRRA